MSPTAKRLHIQYRDRFEERPEVTVILINPQNEALYVEGLKRALARNSPLSSKEWKSIERRIFPRYPAGAGVQVTR